FKPPLKELDRFNLLFIPDDNPPHPFRAFLLRFGSGEWDDLVGANRTVPGKRPPLDGRIVRIRRQSVHKSDAFLRQAIEPGKVIVASIHRQTVSLRQIQVLSDLHISDFTLTDMGQRRQVTIVVKQKAQLYRAFRFSKMHPVKNTGV
ncbi:MAG: hypothetical protein AAF492_28645, partial [Verrucomicrobiota bacterium]